MHRFSYKAVDTAGKTLKGIQEENSPAEVAQHLIGLGLTPLEIKKQSIWNTDVSDISITGKISKEELALFCSQLSFALGSGVTLSRTFEILYTSSFSSSKKLRDVTLEISELLQKGESLSAALEKVKVFPGLVVSMSEVGERSGALSGVMGRLAEYYEAERKMYSEIVNALIYPAIVSVLMLGVVILALVYVLPRYAEMFLAGDVPLPLPTRILTSLSGFIVENYILILLFLSAFAAGVYVYLRTAHGHQLLSWLKLNLPPISGIYRKALNSRFVQAIFIMTDSGMEMTSALETARGVLENETMEDALDRVIGEMRAGESLSVSLSRITYFDRLLTSMISLAEESGTLPDMLKACAAHLQRETETALFRLNKLVEPVITITLGAVLAFIMLAIMLPTFYMTNMI